MDQHLTPEERLNRQGYAALAPNWDEENPPHWRDSYWDYFTGSVRKSGLVLDLGCGTARDASLYLESGLRYIGIDLSELMLGVGQARWQSRDEVGLAAMTMRELGFRGEAFDAFTCITSFMHIPRPELPHVLREVRRVLKTGSRGMISVPEGGFEGIFNGRDGEGPDVYCACWELEPLSVILREAGFRIVHGEVLPSGMLIFFVEKA